jgi:hypothetical protein
MLEEIWRQAEIICHKKEFFVTENESKRECIVCKQMKSVEDFYMCSGKPYRKRSCKACHQEKVMAGYRKNIDQRKAAMREYSRRRYQALKERVDDVHG